MPPFNMKLSRQSKRAAQHLEASGDFRVLKRLPRIDEIWARSMPVPDAAKTITLAVVDTETTGLDPARDALLELAIVKMRIDAETGELLDIEPPVFRLEDPGTPISDETEALTGLSDAILAGQAFDDVAIAAALSDVTFAAAHNGRFDSAFFRARFPGIVLPWACSCSEVTWADHGLGGARSLYALLTRAGLFADCEHRAGPDAWATAMLLALPGQGGKTIAWHLWNRAKRATHRLSATRAPIAVKDSLKAAGYRWSPVHRVWWTEGDPEAMAHESQWLKALCPVIEPTIERISWHNRHSS